MAAINLTQKQKEAVRHKIIRNILEKINSGKSITAREQRIYEESTADNSSAGRPDWVRSYSDLSRLFGPHRASFPRFRKQFPSDCPKPRANGDHSVAAWRAFFAVHPELTGKSDQALAGPAAHELKESILREELRKIHFENDVAENLYLLKSHVDAWLVDICEKIKAVLTNKLRNELPPKIEGLRAAEIAAKMDPVIAEIVSLLRK
jgi:hypothetical protein